MTALPIIDLALTKSLDPGEFLHEQLGQASPDLMRELLALRAPPRRNRVAAGPSRCHRLVLGRRRRLASAHHPHRHRDPPSLSPDRAKPERHGRPAGSRAHFLKLTATGGISVSTHLPGRHLFRPRVSSAPADGVPTVTFSGKWRGSRSVMWRSISARVSTTGEKWADATGEKGTTGLWLFCLVFGGDAGQGVDAEVLEPVAGVFEGHQRTAKLQLTVTLSPAEAVPGLYVHPDHRRRLRRSAVRSDLNA